MTEMSQVAAINCTPKSLPPSQWIPAAATATAENPCNQPALALGLACQDSPVLDPAHIAVMTSRWWGKNGVDLSVQFLDNPPADLRARILLHMNAWSKTANVSFRETSGTGQVRIARTPGDGYWSYLGTDIIHIPTSQATMNLEAFTMTTPDSEFYRVVRHETGHTLGCPHEHLRRQLVALLDRAKTLAYFERTQGWSAQMVIQQVLTPLDEGSLLGTPQGDQLSIMCYQIPGECTISGVPIAGGTDIDRTDYELLAKVYPPIVVPPPPPPPPPTRPAIVAVAVTYADGTTQTLPR